ncbi:DNA topoisomerase 3-alpha, partial [Anabrus simplex]|uniref:DNA topoisomerase 3-alpha n=1 Tax=Anabrus simplex TaxID=316456 RepID=UPI0035A3BE11
MVVALILGYLRERFQVHCIRYFSRKATELPESPKMKVLNVAEKNDAAKNLAGFMSSNVKRREGFSKYNKIYEFNYTLFGQNCEMIMTSVSGHLLGLDFVGNYRKWQGCSPLTLFDAPVMKHCPSDYNDIKRTLEREVRKCAILIIWTDCDREGENIGFEIIQVCTAVKNNLQVYRAKFSEITRQSVTRAIQNLVRPDKKISDAVDVRQELDLRIGAAFTRFQTLRLTRIFPQSLNNALISYGSCQFPTLGFVVERFKSIQNFIPEPFWKIRVNHTVDGVSVEFAWKRVRLFDQLACQVLYDCCVERPLARVENVQSKPKSKWRPLPLDTVELEKLASRKLKIGAKETMRIAEKLYSQGFISYPRTETNIFPKELNLRNLVEQQTHDPAWGEFANRILQDGPNPRQGKKSDQAHPPIHPTKHTTSLTGNEQRLYELVTRHFLACCSKDAEGSETIVDIDIAGEKFVASGLMILARNYLDVYPYEKWNAKEILIYQVGQTFTPTNLEMVDGETNAPRLLTEADLIALMEKHGIGTDATHADHIETIKTRLYVGLENEKFFVPGHLGMGLVEGYDNMGFPMSKPNLRAELEADLKRICEGTKDPKVVLAEQLAKYKEVFRLALEQASKIDEALGKYLEERAQQPPADNPVLQEEVPPNVLKCPACGLDMVLRTRKENRGKYISCMGFPNCRNAVWLPGNVEDVQISDETCPECGPDVHKLKFTFRRGSFIPFYPDRHVGCIGGCDMDLLEALNIDPSIVRRPRGNAPGGDQDDTADSGFGSTDLTRALTLVTQANTNRWRDATLRDDPPPVWGTATNTLSQSRGTGVGRGSSRGRGSGRGRGSSVSVTTQGGGRGTPNNSSLQNGSSSISDNSFQSSGRGSSASSTFQSAREATAFSNRTGNRVPSGSMVAANSIGFASGVNDENAIVCDCTERAILLTVRKEGPNTGRQFYKCKESKCNFFLWATDGNSDANDGSHNQQNKTPLAPTFTVQPSNWQQPQESPAWRYNDNNSGGSEVMCDCGAPARRLTVQKEGPNKGRQFYGCSKPPNERCRFFKWADDADQGNNGDS